MSITRGIGRSIATDNSNMAYGSISEHLESPTTVPQTQTAEAVLNKTLATMAASLSMMGALIIITTYIVWPELRTNSRKIIVCISISDFSVACLNTIGIYNPHTENFMCEIQATLNVVAVLSSFLWTVYLSLFFYLTICRKISIASEKRTMVFFHTTAWGIPFSMAAFAYGLNGVGYSRDMVSSGWCWISTDQPFWRIVMWMLVTGKGWEFLAYIAISVFYVLVKREIRLGLLPGGDFLTPKAVEVVKKADRKLTFIPVVFVLLRIWGTIRFFRFLVYYPADPPLLKWLVLLQGVGDCSQGFANFVLFCLFTEKIREKFRLGCVRSTSYSCSRREKEPLFESTNFPLNETSDFPSYGARDCIIAYTDSL